MKLKSFTVVADTKNRDLAALTDQTVNAWASDSKNKKVQIVSINSSVDFHAGGLGMAFVTVVYTEK